MNNQTENYLRNFMRDCQRFWSRQWYVGKDKIPHLWSYEQSLIGVYADMKGAVINKHPYFAEDGEVISEADCCRVFNTEFSGSWEDAKKHYCPGGVISCRTITNGDSIYANGGMDALLDWIKENTL